VAPFITLAVTVQSMAALLLAVMADKRLRGATAYKTLLIWPYAVAPAVAAVLWLFIFHPSIGVLGQAVRKLGVVWDYKLDGAQAMFLVVLAASWKQVSYNFLFFRPGCIHPEAGDRGRRHRRGSGPPLLSITSRCSRNLLLVSTSSTLLRDLQHHPRIDGPGKAAGPSSTRSRGRVINRTSASSASRSSDGRHYHSAAVQFRRGAAGPLLMVERKARAAWLPHAILLAGVMIFAFPIYTALIGSTHDAATIGRGDLPLYPGPHGVENYTQAWTQGSGQRVNGSPVARMMTNSFLMAVVIAVGKIAVSLISAYAVVFFAFPLRMFFFWMIFITLMLRWGADHPHVQGGVGSAPDQHLQGLTLP
jgi:ABC-type sugar transport system permease subunit